MLKTVVKKGSYHDSVVLMLLTNHISTIEGVKKVSIMMATPANKDIFKQSGLDTEELMASTANDMVIVADIDDESMMDTCVLYGRIVIAFNAAFMLQNIFQSFFVVAEKPRLGLIVTIAAGVTNMVLDALFVGVFKWGIVGAALATGISQSIGGLLPLLYFALPNNSPLQLTRTGFELAPLLKASSNGCSELMSHVASSLIGIVYNYQLMRLGGENAVATYGVLMYIQFVFIAIFIGYSVGSAPIIGYR